MEQDFPHKEITAKILSAAFEVYKLVIHHSGLVIRGRLARPCLPGQGASLVGVGDDPDLKSIFDTASPMAKTRRPKGRHGQDNFLTVCLVLYYLLFSCISSLS